MQFVVNGRTIETDERGVRDLLFGTWRGGSEVTLTGSGFTTATSVVVRPSIGMVIRRICCHGDAPSTRAAS
mgnify:CR=1 FL=1